MDWITGLWDARIMPFLYALWESLLFWRILSFSLLGIFSLAFLFRDTIRTMLLQEDKIKHDKELFQLLNLIMPEGKLFAVLEQLEKAHSYDTRNSQYVDKFRSALAEEKRQYLTPKLKKTSLSLRDALNKMRKFIEAHFIVFPDAQAGSNSSFQMYPDPSLDGGGSEQRKDESKYNTFYRELIQHTDSVRKAYQKYRDAVKKIIRV